MKNMQIRPIIRIMYSMHWNYALTVKNPQGEEVNYSKEMLKLYFQNEDPELTFCLIHRKKDRNMWIVIKQVFLRMAAQL